MGAPCLRHAQVGALTAMHLDVELIKVMVVRGEVIRSPQDGTRGGRGEGGGGGLAGWERGGVGMTLLFVRAQRPSKSPSQLTILLFIGGGLLLVAAKEIAQLFRAGFL